MTKIVVVTPFIVLKRTPNLCVFFYISLTQCLDLSAPVPEAFFFRNVILIVSFVIYSTIKIRVSTP